MTKPELRGVLIQQIKANLFAGFVSASAITRYMVNYKKCQNYQNFHKNHDLDRDDARLKKAGVFKGIPYAEWQTVELTHVINYFV